MAMLVTEAIVLHSFDYLESSRILRLATRGGGVRSVLARGARASRRRFGSGLDLFAQGTAQIYTKLGRDLDTLSAFDALHARAALAAELPRFAGASAIAELTMRFAGGDADPSLFDAVADALDAIAGADARAAREATLGGAWGIVAELGLAPNIDNCGECHATIAADEAVLFSHPAGGALCARCARLAPSGRQLPPRARAALGAWVSRTESVAARAIQDDGDVRAHQRLLREFLHEHLLDDRPLRAYEVWEHALWSAA